VTVARLFRTAAGVIGGIVVVVFLTATTPAQAAAPPDVPGPATTVPDGASPLVVVPPSCPQLDPAAVSFVGTVVGKDDVVQVVRFQIDQLRAGSARPWAIDGLIDVRFGDDYRFLDVDGQYLVGAGFDPEYGALSSAVRPPEPDFGGNDVVGVDDSSVVCPAVDQPIRTLNVDGTDVDSGVLSLLFDDRRVLLATIAVPTAIVLVALVVLVLLRMVAGLASKGVFELGRAAVTPVPDHRAVRVRSHRND
jgi:energy-converting hydrogenase Eha subunit E